MEREVRYCTTEDGVRIAYCVEGDGPPLVICPFFTESLAFTSEVTGSEDFYNRLGEGRQLIRFDMRGTGLSQRDGIDFSGNSGVLDIEAVVEGCGLTRFALWGAGISGPRAITYAARHPEQVSHLILWGTFATGKEAYTPETVKGLAQLARSNWEMASQVFADISLREKFPEVALEARDNNRKSITGNVMADLLEQGYEDTDATPDLARVKAPTLVLHRVDDPGFPFAGGQRIAAGIPGALLVPLPGSVSYFFLDDTEPTHEAIREFLKDQASPGSTPPAGISGSVRTVLFTDLVGHTEMMSRLGDERGRDVLREHERITREVLKGSGGTEVKTMGDGFMASFSSVTRGVECAIALQRAFADRNASTAHPEALEGRAEPPRLIEPLNVRVGLNAGEPIEEDGDLFGATVILASRIAAKADGGEILVADTVRGLCSGKGFLFADRGEFVAKGFEEPVRVYEVSWQRRDA